MKIAFITHYTSLYGANRSLLSLIDGLREYDVEPHVIVPAEGDITKELNNRSVPFALIPLQFWVDTKDFGNFGVRWLERYIRWRCRTIKHLCRNIKALPSLIRTINLWNIDIVYTNSSVTPMGAIIAQITHRPHIWHLREFGDLDYGLVPDWGKTVFLYYIRKADAKIAVSKAIKEYYLKNKNFNNVYVIYNGIASRARFDQLYNNEGSRVIRKQDKPYTFTLVGLIHPHKGQDTAIRALEILSKDHPKVRLLIVGAGNTKHLESLASELGVEDNVEFWGHIKDPYEAYLKADAVLMCSKYEAMGRVTVEAMSACRPVIGYDQAGTSELIKHGYNGLLYNGEAEELANCMKQFITNPRWACELGKNGWNFAREECCIENYTKSIHEVLSSVYSK